MWSTATPRNTTVNSNTGAISSLSLVLSPSSTVTGDVGVIMLAANITGTAAFTPPSGWSSFTFGSTGTFYSVLQIINALTAGVTSLTISATGTVVHSLLAVYACWPGGAALNSGGVNVFEGGNLAFLALGSGTNPMPSVSTVSTLVGTDIAIWSGTEGFSAGSAIPGNPTGTGTWTNVNSGQNSTGLVGLNVCAQIVASGATATASGATGTASAAQISSIVAVLGQGTPAFEVPQAVKRAAFYFNWTPPWQNRKSGLVVPGFADKRLAIP